MVDASESERGSTLCELARLDRTRPGLDASAGEVASWYAAKAATHAHLSAEAEMHGDVFGAARERRFARQAAAHAARPRAGEVSPA